MKKQEKTNIMISIMAVIISLTSLYYSNFQEPDIDFYCGLQMEIFQCGDTLGIYLPFSFVNNSNKSGNILDIKISLSPIDSSIIQIDSLKKIDAKWNEIWNKVITLNNSGYPVLENRPLSQIHTLTIVENSADYHYINFYPLKSKFNLTKGKYFIEVYVKTNYKERWLKKEYSFDYKNKMQVWLKEYKKKD